MTVRILVGDALTVLRTLPSASVHCVCTSPPYYGLRSYLPDGHSDKGLEIGAEATPEAWAANLVVVFREVRRVLRPDGVLFVNVGDSYAGSGKGPSSSLQRPSSCGHTSGVTPPPGYKAKDLIGAPWLLAFALRADGWYLRSEIIWAKPNPMPESVGDRPTKSHEQLFLLSKSRTYYYDADSIREPPLTIDRPGERQSYPPGSASHMNGGVHIVNSAAGLPLNPAGRNKRSVWTVATEAFPESHFATYPTALVEPCIKAGTSERGVCPACGAPWVRVRAPTEAYKGRLTSANDRGDWYPRNGTVEKRADGTKHGKLEGGISAEYVTTGWRPSCAHPGEPVPATVLDCFGGAGTTALVADRLGRNAILVELKPEYAAMARRRIDNDAPLFAGVPYQPIVKVVDKQGQGSRTYAGFNARWDAKEETA